MVTWPRPLRPYEVDVAAAELDVNDAVIADLATTLSPEERERAERFRLPIDRRRFVARRGFLRRFLGEQLAAPPSDLRYASNTYGKLRLTGGAAHTDLRFSASHSGPLALYAFSLGREIGVDVERVADDRAELAAATRFFSPTEVADLGALAADVRPRAFFCCWTRKEAFVKARGIGLQMPLDQFDVSVRPEEPAAVRSTRWDPAEASRWSVVSLDPAPGFVGALAIEGGRPIVHFRKEASS